MYPYAAWGPPGFSDICTLRGFDPGGFDQRMDRVLRSRVQIPPRRQSSSPTGRRSCGSARGVRPFARCVGLETKRSPISVAFTRGRRAHPSACENESIMFARPRPRAPGERSRRLRYARPSSAARELAAVLPTRWLRSTRPAAPLAPATIQDFEMSGRSGSAARARAPSRNGPAGVRRGGFPLTTRGTRCAGRPATPPPRRFPRDAATISVCSHPPPPQRDPRARVVVMARHSRGLEGNPVPSAATSGRLPLETPV